MKIWHPASRRFGWIICGTSDHADGTRRVIVEWQDGTESAVSEAELKRAR